MFRMWSTSLALLVACTGVVGETPPETEAMPPFLPSDDVVPDEPLDCTSPHVGEFTVRRLNVIEYSNTIEALFGQQVGFEDVLPADVSARGFDNQAEVQEASLQYVERTLEAAERVTDNVLGDGIALLGCDVAAEGMSCFETFLEDFGQRIFRRPLHSEEQERFREVFSQQAALSGPLRALELVIQGMLISPSFLYVVEDSAGTGTERLSPYELASRLSYLLWNTMPDAELMESAANGDLETPEGLEAQARRLVEDTRSAQVVRDFYVQWSGARGVEIPADPSLALAAEEEIERFVDQWYVDGGSAPDLLTDRRSFVNDELAAHYDLPGAGDAYEPVELPADRYAGILTRAAFLGSHPIPPNRGDFILTKLVCSPLSAPPAEIPEPPSGTEYPTRRARFEAHSDQPCAAGCHTILDPIGFAFEHFDESGRWRDTDNGYDVDASTELAFRDELDVLNGPISGAIELSERLAESDAFLECQASKWFTYAYHRPALRNDGCSLQDLSDAFVETRGDVRAMLLELVRSDAFQLIQKGSL